MSANVHRTAQTERNRPWLRFGLAFLFIFLGFLIVLALTTPLLDPVQRWFAAPVSFSVADGAFTAQGDALFCAGETALWRYAADGSAAEYPADFSAPRFRRSGEQLLVFDEAGRSFALLRETPQPLAADGALFDAAVAENGGYALLFDTADCRAVLEVYDPTGALRFRYRAKTAFLNTCALSPDASLAAVTALGERGLAFESTLCLYRCDSEDAPLTWPLDGMPYACGFLSGEALYVAGSEGVSLYRTDGTPLLTLPDSRLLAQGENALLTAKDDTVQLYDADGALLAAVTVETEPTGAALCGEYLALQFEASLRVYTRDFRLCGQTEAEGFCLREDGTVWCINARTAARWIP